MSWVRLLAGFSDFRFSQVRVHISHVEIRGRSAHPRSVLECQGIGSGAQSWFIFFSDFGPSYGSDLFADFLDC